jgi:hypothetical protein
MAGFTHIYMPRACEAKDPIERMKNVVACFVGTMTLSSGNFLKPLNPILGETCQVLPPPYPLLSSSEGGVGSRARPSSPLPFEGCTARPIKGHSERGKHCE